MRPQRLFMACCAAACCAAACRAAACCAAPARAEPPREAISGEAISGEAPERDVTWRARLGVGLNPVARSSDRLPTVHSGFGASLAGFVQLPYRVSAGLGFDWERYTFDSNNSRDGARLTPRYTGEPLTHTRLMALVQWDILRRRFITPFLLVGLGYGWEDAEVTDWQCSPALMSGLVVGAGGGLELAVHESIGVGVEYRIN
jgi:opacity protein-like surface antigen